MYTIHTKHVLVTNKAELYSCISWVKHSTWQTGWRQSKKIFSQDVFNFFSAFVQRPPTDVLSEEPLPASVDITESRLLRLTKSSWVFWTRMIILTGSRERDFHRLNLSAIDLTIAPQPHNTPASSWKWTSTWLDPTLTFPHPRPRSRWRAFLCGPTESAIDARIMEIRTG